MSKSTFKILFYLRKNQVNKDGTVCIMIRLQSPKRNVMLFQNDLCGFEIC